jgi:hypothetical protein
MLALASPSYLVVFALIAARVCNGDVRRHMRTTLREGDDVIEVHSLVANRLAAEMTNASALGKDRLVINGANLGSEHLRAALGVVRCVTRTIALPSLALPLVVTFAMGNIPVARIFTPLRGVLAMRPAHSLPRCLRIRIAGAATPLTFALPISICPLPLVLPAACAAVMFIAATISRVALKLVERLRSQTFRALLRLVEKGELCVY